MAASQSSNTYMTPGTPPQGAPSAGTIKPTLLAFHGSGSNATIHSVQLARLMRVLKPHFNVESLEAPFPSPAGPGILPFFDGCGPFKRWLPPAEKVSLEEMSSGTSTDLLSPDVEAVVRAAVAKVRGQGGRVVGLIGFSQGTKVVAGLLQGAQIRRALGARDQDWCDFRFALSVCPSYPPPLCPGAVAALLDEAGMGEAEKKELRGRKIRLPSLLVLGSQDEWNWAGKKMVEGYYEQGDGKSEVVEWDMGHHYPVAVGDNEKIRDWLLSALAESRKEDAV